MYTFCIEKGHISLVKITVVNDIVEKDSYFRNLVEKCFERVFQMIKVEKNSSEEKDSSEEADLEEGD